MIVLFKAKNKNYVLSLKKLHILNLKQILVIFS